MGAEYSNSGEQDRGRDLLEQVTSQPSRAGMIVVFSIDFLRTMGPVDLAYEMQTSTSWVIYHLRILEMAGLLETAGEKLNYEGYERFFRLVEQPPPGPPATPR